MNEVAELPRTDLTAIGRQTAIAAKGEIKTFFESNKSAIANLVRGRMDVDRLLLVAHTAIRNNPGLQKCTVKSLFGATITAGLMNLEPNTPDGHLFFIPRKRNRKVNGRNEETWEVNVQLGYKGRRVLAMRSPTVRDISTHVVYEKDKFRPVEGSHPRLEHEPYVGDRGQPIAYYARAQLSSGSVVFEWMTVAEVNRVRDRYSDAYKYAIGEINEAERTNKGWLAAKIREQTPWIANFDAMARKTVLIRLISQQLPIDTPAAMLAAALDDRENARQSLGKVLDAEHLEEIEMSPPVAFDDDEEEEITTTTQQAKVETQPSATVQVLRPTEAPVTSEATKPVTAPTETSDERRAVREPSGDLLNSEPVWFSPLTGRARTAAQRAYAEGVQTIEQARAHDWRKAKGVGDSTLAEIYTLLGIEPPTERTEMKAEAKVEAKGTTQVTPPARQEPPPATSEDDFGFGEME